MIGGYITRILRSFDQTMNAILLGNTDQTLSARCYEGRVHGVKWCIVAEKILDVVFFWEPNHCEASFFTDPSELTYENKNGDGVRGKQD